MHRLSTLWVVGFIAASCLPLASSRADVITLGASQGYGIQVDLTAAGLISVDLLDLTPGQLSSGTAPGAYSESASLVDVAANVGIPGVLDLLSSTGAASSSAVSNVDGAAGLRTTTATGTVDNLVLDLANIPLAPALVNLSATTISSTSTVDGGAGVLTPSSSMTIEDLQINLAGSALDLSAFVDGNGNLTANPNTQLLNVGGIANLDLILNEQVTVGDGSSTQSIETNAIRLRFNGVAVGALGNILTGDVRIGHSLAGSISAVPEPSSLALLLVGIAGVGIRRRRD